MNVSKINMYTPSFGQVRKSAAQRAIREARGNYIRLSEIKALVDSQKDNNDFDIREHKGVFSSIHKYEVFGKNHYWRSFKDLESACADASMQKANCEAWQKYLSIPTVEAAEGERKRLASEILAECED